MLMMRMVRMRMMMMMTTMTMMGEREFTRVLPLLLCRDAEILPSAEQ